MFGFHHHRATSVSPRPKSSHASAPRWDSGQIAHQPLPPMSPAMTLPDHISHVRPRASTQSPKRLSVLGSRSRSNTATSTSSSSYKSPASSMTSVEASSQRSSQDGKTQTTVLPPVEKQDGPSKSFLSRGSRILRRQGSKVSISNSPIADEQDDARERERLEGLGILFRSHHRPRHSDMHELLKRTISDPYDFQHVTHTSPGQLPPANHTHMNDLATEFSVIRASQRPRAELKGIKADSLHFRNFSSDDVSTFHASSDLHTRSPPRSPDARRSPTSPNGRSKRMSRSVENFSRPVSKLQKQPPSPSMLAPPRSSSRQAFPPSSPEPTCQNIDALLGLDAPQTFPENVYATREDDDRERKASLSHLDLAGVFPDGITHAVTTNDDTSQYVKPSPVNAHAYELADVPEEDESAAWRNSYVANSGLSTPGPSFRHGRSNSRFGFHRPLPIASLAANKLSAGLEALGSPTIPADRSQTDESAEKQPRTLAKRQSIALRQVAEDTWEDDIDYCYEHAAESNCDFDWQRTSIDEPTSSQKPGSLTPCGDGQGTEDGTPELPVSSPETGSHSQATDRSTNLTPKFGSLNLVMPNSTPVYGDQLKPVQHTVYVKPDHGALIGPQFDDSISQDNAYDGLIQTVQDGDGQYVFYPQSEEHIESSRGSCSPLSKCNSQESIILSRAASIARKHRSSLSTTNVPELVHSANGSCETVDRDASSPSSEQAQSSPVHRRSKSLVREASRNLTSIKVPAFEVNDVECPDAPNTPTHDRSKSASVLEMQDSARSMKPIASRQRSSTVTRGMSGRKTRTSYSLFPNPISPPPPTR